MVFTYLIKSIQSDCYYVGITADVSRRLMEHNHNKVKSTANRGPYELMFEKQHKDYVEARKHEKWLKKKGKDYKNFISSLWITGRGLAPPVEAG